MVITLFILTNFSASFAEESCIPTNKWFVPNTGGLFTTKEYNPQLPSKGIVLLGEHHENSAHHRWQLEIIKSLHKKQPNMAIGLEMFPRYLQHLLDDWLSRKIDNDTFINLSQWNEIWSVDFNEYRPIFEYARDNSIPLVAINVQKQLLQMVREVGWQNIPEDHRQGISDPAKPSKHYLTQLAVSFQRHFTDPSQIDKRAFARFVEQQQLWDRVMAESLAENHPKYPLVVGLMGSWHIINGFGVPHQLKDLKQNQVVSYVPWDQHLDCHALTDQFASAIYGSPTP